jgi:hypothetical protein
LQFLSTDLIFLPHPPDPEFYHTHLSLFTTFKPKKTQQTI